MSEDCHESNNAKGVEDGMGDADMDAYLDAKEPRIATPAMKDESATTRTFDPELQAASIACDCRKRKDYHCNLCRRAWDQAWDLAEGKILPPTAPTQL